MSGFFSFLVHEIADGISSIAVHTKVKAAIVSYDSKTKDEFLKDALIAVDATDKKASELSQLSAAMSLDLKKADGKEEDKRQKRDMKWCSVQAKAAYWRAMSTGLKAQCFMVAGEPEAARLFKAQYDTHKEDMLRSFQDYGRSLSADGSGVRKDDVSAPVDPGFRMHNMMLPHTFLFLEHLSIYDKAKEGVFAHGYLDDQLDQVQRADKRHIEKIFSWQIRSESKSLARAKSKGQAISKKDQDKINEVQGTFEDTLLLHQVSGLMDKAIVAHMAKNPQVAIECLEKVGKFYPDGGTAMFDDLLNKDNIHPAMAFTKSLMPDSFASTIVSFVMRNNPKLAAEVMPSLTRWQTPDGKSPFASAKETDVPTPSTSNRPGPKV